MPVQPTSAEVGDSAVEGKARSVSEEEVSTPAAEESAATPENSAASPEPAEPEAAKPEPELATPQLAEPESAELESVQPESVQPESAEPESAGAAANKPESAEPESGGAAAAESGPDHEPDRTSAKLESAAKPAAAQPAAKPAATQRAEAKPAAAATGTGWRAPGLDGVRAIAVLAVLAFHENLPWIPGGFLGVDVFFVLSGFLITDLLAARYRRHGSIGLGGFYQRRVRRLLPALALMLVTVTAAVTLLEPSQRTSLRPALLGAVTYTSNWWQAFAHLSYFNQYGPPPAFQHLWSLAVEEQFYLIWPLILTAILVAIRRPRARAACAWAGALASALVMLALYTPGSDPSLVYYGTDTHASALMIGSALALTWPLAKVAATRGRALRLLDIAGAAGIVALAWAMWHLAGPDSFVYPYGLVLAALASGALILAAAATGRIGTALSWRPLRWLGVRSYGIYLWHWPVIALTVGLAPRSAGTATARLIDLAVPVGLAAASWHWLEQPILRNGLRAELAHRLRLLVLAPRAVARTPGTARPLLTAVVVVAMIGTAVYGLASPPSGRTLQQQIEAGARFSSTTLVPPEPVGQPAPWFVVPGRDLPFRHPLHSPAPVRRAKAPPVTGARVMAIGDSVMLASAPELAAAMPGISINAKVSRAMIAGISIIDELARSGRLRKVVVVGLGTNGPITADQVRQLRNAVGDRWLVLVNTFVPRSWEHEVNTTIATAAKRYPNVLLVNWHAAIENHQNLLWSDHIHPQPVGGTLYAKVVRAVVLRALRQRQGPKPPSPPRSQPPSRHLRTHFAARHVPPTTRPGRAG
ncbi:MAG: acyltransferase family protein [Streptosporangiaceae bacterium]